MAAPAVSGLLSGRQGHGGWALPTSGC